jgi:alkylation response protein AidB-like acyl-CoA dehydrogenase
LDAHYLGVTLQAKGNSFRNRESRFMSFEMKPVTDAGSRLVEAIRLLAPTLSERSKESDRRNEICVSNYRDIQSTGIASAFVPSELGGFGLTSMHDWILAVSALAQGDGSTGIAMSMHFSATRGMAARLAAETDDATRARLSAQLCDIASGDMLICSTTTESGTDNLHPLTEAIAVGDEWELNGTKYFVTMSSVATHCALNVRTRADGGDHIANVLVPMDTPGIRQGGDWDALGMRASGSQSVTFTKCRAPAWALRIVGPWGQWSIPVLVNRTLANVPLVGAFLGIAQSAYAMTIDDLTKRPKRASEGGVQHMVAEMQIKLTMCQCLMSQMGHRLDAFMAAPPPSLEEAHELMKDYQSIKWVVNREAINIVNSAMDLCGGRGFTASNPLTRLYRDVRAGPFMQPYSPVDAREYIGRVEVGHWPSM